MPRFHYQALNADQQLVYGEIEADAVAAALALLEEQGVVVQSIGFATAETTALLAQRKAPTPTPPAQHPKFDPQADERILLSRLEQTLAQAKPIVPALRAYAAELPAGRRRRELSHVCEILDCEDATAAASSLTRLPEYWIPLIGSINAPSTSVVLERFFAESHAAQETRRRWSAVLAYPLFLLLFAALVMVALAVLVIPTFRAIFDDFGLLLPRLTVWTLNVAAWITSGRIVFVLLAVAAVVGAVTWYCGRTIADWFVAFCDRSTTISRFARFTADLLQGGLPLPDAVRIAGRASRSSTLSQASQRLAVNISYSEVHRLPQVPKPLTPTLLSALGSNISPSARIALLETLADCYADRAQSRFSWTQGTLGPLAIFGVAFIVGFVVLSLFLPLVSLINNLA